MPVQIFITSNKNPDIQSYYFVGMSLLNTKKVIYLLTDPNKIPKDLPDGYLYLATAKEITLDLVAEPERMPVDFAHTNLDLESDTPRSIFVL